MLNAVIYARYSSDKQTEQSIEGQLRICTAYAEQNNLNVVHHYIDRAMSGTNDRRPEFQQMISDSSSKQFKYIIVYKFDRFARNMYDSAIYEHKLEQNGVKVLSATEQVGDGNESLIIKAVLRAMAEMYSKQLAENVRRGMRESALKANSTGGSVPFGYKAIDKKLVIDEMCAPYVRYIFEAYAGGKPKMDIVRELQHKGCLKHNGKPLTMQNVTYILSNKKYAGFFVFNDIEVEGGCPAIVDKALFKKCAERYDRERKRYGNSATGEVDYLLVGKLFCGYCGKPMIGDCGTSRNGERHHYYTCYTRKSRRRTGENCQKKSERKGFIEWYITHQTQEYVLSENRIEIISELVVKEYDLLFGAVEENALNKRLKEVDKDIDMAVDALLKTSNKTALDKINDQLDELEKRKSDIEIDIANLHIAKKVRLTKDEVSKWLRSLCKGNPIDVEYQRRIIDTFINAIYLYDDKVVMYFNARGGKQVSYIEMLEHSQQIDDECSNSSGNGSPCYKLSEHAYLFVCQNIFCFVARR